MEPLTRNGGFIGATLDFGTDEYYTTIGEVSSPVLVGQTSSGAAGSTSMSVPAGTAVGDLAILYGGADFAFGSLNVADTTLCTSWTTVAAGQNDGQAGHNWGVFYGTVAQVVGVMAIDSSGYASGWGLLIFRNATVGNVLNENFLTNTVANPPAINVSSGSTVVTVCGYDDRSGTISPPTGYTSIGSYAFSAGTSAFLIGSAYKSGLSAGTEDPSAMTASDGSDYCSAATIELIPTASAEQGNKKNSGIWDLPAVYETLYTPAGGTPENAIFANLPTNGSTTFSMSGLSFKAGDNLFAFLYDENGGDPPTFNESGWTQLQYTNSAGTGTGMLYHKIADGTETSVSVTFFGQYDFLGMIFYAINGSYTYQSSSQLFQTSGNPNPPVVSNFVAGDISLVFGAYGDDIAVITPSVGYTKLAGGTSGVTARGCSMAMGSADNITGNYDPGPFSGAGDENYAVHVRLSKP